MSLLSSCVSFSGPNWDRDPGSLTMMLTRLPECSGSNDIVRDNVPVVLTWERSTSLRKCWSTVLPSSSVSISARLDNQASRAEPRRSKRFLHAQPCVSSPEGFLLLSEPPRQMTLLSPQASQDR